MNQNLNEIKILFYKMCSSISDKYFPWTNWYHIFTGSHEQTILNIDMYSFFVICWLFISNILCNAIQTLSQTECSLKENTGINLVIQTFFQYGLFYWNIVFLRINKEIHMIAKHDEDKSVVAALTNLL